MTSVLRRQGDYSATERPTVGDLKMSLVGVDHIGWLRCNGRPVPIAAFRQLFDVVGHQFGTDVSDGFFRLPNPQGRVLGIAGASPDGVTSEWAIGDVSGYETHTLTLPEIPIHNHDVSGETRFEQGWTTNSLTGVTVDASGTHFHTGTTDLSGAHRHGYDDAYFAENPPNTGIYGTSANTDFDNSYKYRSPRPLTDESGNHVHTFTTNPAGLHTHFINDPTHNHRINPNGGDQPHNNIQPTIWIGNLFVYSGRLFREAPNGTNYFPPNSYSPSTGVPVNIF
jgi:microcystin-dependent protein